MPLEKQILSIDLSGGVDTKTDEKLVIPTSLTLLENGVFTKGSTITKRNGYSSLSTSILGGGSITTAEKIYSIDEELLLVSNKTIYGYVENQNTWVSKGSFATLFFNTHALIRNTAQQSLPDIAYYNNLALIVYEDDGGGVRASVLDTQSNLYLVENALISATASYPRAIKIDTGLFVFFADGSSWKQRKLNSTYTGFEAEGTLATDLNTTPYQALVSRGDHVIFAYSTNANQITIGYITKLGILGSLISGFVAPVILAEDADNCLDLIVNSASDKIYVAWHNGTNGVRVSRYNLNLSVDLAPATVDSTLTVINGISMSENTSTLGIDFFYEVNAAATYNRFLKKNTLTQPATIGTASVLRRGLGLASRSFRTQNIAYILGVHESNLQSTYFLLNDSGLIYSKAFQGVASGVSPKNMIAGVVSPTTNHFFIPVGIKTALESSNGDVFTKEGLSILDFDTSSFSGESASFGGILYLAGGVLSMYNGSAVIEHGFHLYPENVSSVAATSGGSLTDGAYQHKIVYSFMDYKGNVHFSAPSVGLSTTVSGSGGNGKITLTIPTLRLTSKGAVTIEVYRAQVNLSTILYKVGTVANDTTTDTVSFQDTFSDASILSNAILYTTGGILENIVSPGSRVLATYQDRLFVVPLENQSVLNFSKHLSPGLPLEFNDTLTKSFDQIKTITGAMEMDDKLLIFERNRVFTLSGEGPLNTGEQDTFSAIGLLTSDTGCSGSSSLVLSPLGIMFSSPKGIYLISRGLEPSYIGASVEDYTLKEVITGAQLIQDQNQIRFLTSGDVTLVFDYYYNKWGVFTNAGGLSSVNWNGVYSYLRSTGGKVFKENAGVYLDDNAFIVLRIVTSWIKLTNVQGFQRAYRANILGEFLSDHKLKIKVAYDYQPFFNDEYSFDFLVANNVQNYGDASPFGNGLFGGDSDGVYQFRIHLAQQKCESIRFSFEDSQKGTTNQSFSLSAMTLLMGMKQGIFKMKSQLSL